MTRRFVIFIVMAAAVIAAVKDKSHGHDFWINHSGYKSPLDGSHCCGEDDCFLIPTVDMEATSTGWLIKSLGETVPYAQSFPSEDGEFWRCKRGDGTRRCFFAPQPSS